MAVNASHFNQAVKKGVEKKSLVQPKGSSGTIKLGAAAAKRKFYIPFINYYLIFNS